MRMIDYETLHTYILGYVYVTSCANTHSQWTFSSDRYENGILSQFLVTTKDYIAKWKSCSDEFIDFYEFVSRSKIVKMTSSNLQDAKIVMWTSDLPTLFSMPFIA